MGWKTGVRVSASQGRSNSAPVAHCAVSLCRLVAVCGWMWCTLALIARVRVYCVASSGVVVVNTVLTAAPCQRKGAARRQRAEAGPYYSPHASHSNHNRGRVRAATSVDGNRAERLRKNKWRKRLMLCEMGMKHCREEAG